MTLKRLILGSLLVLSVACSSTRRDWDLCSPDNQDDMLCLYGYYCDVTAKRCVAFRDAAATDSDVGSDVESSLPTDGALPDAGVKDAAQVVEVAPNLDVAQAIDAPVVDARQTELADSASADGTTRD
jgi:hypothetical protein